MTVMVGKFPGFTSRTIYNTGDGKVKESENMYPSVGTPTSGGMNSNDRAVHCIVRACGLMSGMPLPSIHTWRSKKKNWILRAV